LAIGPLKISIIIIIIIIIIITGNCHPFYIVDPTDSNRLPYESTYTLTFDKKRFQN